MRLLLYCRLEAELARLTSGSTTVPGRPVLMIIFSKELMNKVIEGAPNAATRKWEALTILMPLSAMNRELHPDSLRGRNRNDH